MATTLKTTPLNQLHLELGAKMVPFAGYDMPVQYQHGVMKEHLHTRQAAGLFDVSHMGQIVLRGEGAAAALESLVPVDIIDLPDNRQRYALFTNEAGGIKDDLMVTQFGDFILLVVNAACKEEDYAYLQEKIGAQCEMTMLDDRALLALQGPKAAEVLANLWPSLAGLVFMDAARLDYQGNECWVSRSGYTGEDGFEISVPAEQADSLARLLLKNEFVDSIGLGARDSLRLEAGLCLYGHDINTETTPVTAGLQWAISKCRRAEGDRAGGFPGAASVLAQLEQGVDTQRVGVQPLGKAPIREGVQLVDQGGKVVGRITSGGYGPSVKAPIAMGYVNSQALNSHDALFALVRGKKLEVKAVKLPFITPAYFRG